ncbi:Na+/melibiose symporter-like transporter [Opitutaceae bacterium TAV1]|nr:Na+/melibiose symporter-like transporter [Opitutaceae bacterium TAV1]
MPKPSESAARIAESDRIPTVQKIMFAVGVNTDFVATGLLTKTLWMPVFNIGFGISPVLLGVILMVLRGWDAITDPIVGNISDNARTRWGRRRPFMFVAAIATALMYPLFWHMPVAFTETMKTAWLVGVGMVFFLCFSFWSMPFYGLQLELTPSYDERTRLTAWMTFFGKMGYFLGSWILALVMLVGMVALGDPKAVDGRDEFVQGILSAIKPLLTFLAHPGEGEHPMAVGMRVVCWLIALGILCFGICPALFTKERYYKAEAGKQPRTPLLQSLKESSRCTPLWALIGISFFLVLGSASVVSLGQYVNFYYANGGDLAKGALIAGYKGSAMVAVGIVTIPLFTWLGERFDKRTMVMTMLGITMIGHLSNYFLMTPANPYLQIISGAFESCAIASVWLFLPSMKADVADWDERRTSRRREGSINAFYSWFIKAALTGSLGVGGMVLEFSGFDARVGVQPDAVVSRMFHLYLVLPIFIWGGAMVLAWFYPLTRAKSLAIRTELEARRGKM